VLLPAHVLTELRRRANSWTEADTAAAYEHLGVPPDLMPLKVAAHASGCTLSGLRRLCRERRLPHYRMPNGRILVRLRDVLVVHECHLLPPPRPRY